MLLAGIILVFLLQWYIPFSMIFSAEKVLENGRLYRFRTAPVDPVDYFRGRYLALNFNEPEALPGDDYSWGSQGERAFVNITSDSSGFVNFGKVFKHRPNNGEEYIQVKARKHWDDTREGWLLIELPVDRYYMDEFKAEDAETFYNSLNSERRTMEAWVEAKVLDGKMVVEQLVVGNKPIQYWLEIP